MIEFFSILLFFVFLGFLLFVFFRFFKPSIEAERNRNNIIIEYFQILIDKEKKNND